MSIAHEGYVSEKLPCRIGAVSMAAYGSDVRGETPYDEWEVVVQIHDLELATGEGQFSMPPLHRLLVARSMSFSRKTNPPAWNTRFSPSAE